MAKATQGKKKNTKKPAKNNSSMGNEVAGVLLITLGVLCGLAVYSTTNAPVAVAARGVLFGVFGIGGYIAPLLLAAIGALMIAAKRIRISPLNFFMFLLGVISLFSMIHIAYSSYFSVSHGFGTYVTSGYEVGSTKIVGMGAAGAVFAYPPHALLGATGGTILCAALLLISIMVIANISIKRVSQNMARAGKQVAERVSEVTAERREERREYRAAQREPRKPLFVEDLEFEPPAQDDLDIISDFQAEVAPEDDEGGVEPLSDDGFDVRPRRLTDRRESFEEMTVDGYGEDDEYAPEGLAEDNEESALNSTGSLYIEGADELDDAGDEEPPFDTDDDEYTVDITSDDDALRLGFGAPPPRPAPRRNIEPEAEAPRTVREYAPPPMELLTKGSGAPKGNSAEIRRISEVLENTLKSFNISAKVVGVSRGPSVTRYELSPAAGVKISRIVALQNDIAMNLAARSIRIEAPIPGKAAVGIEVPNTECETVGARDLIDNTDFLSMKSSLAFCLGKDLSGKNVYSDLVKMPHLLIAGTTGSGKSVCANIIIMSMIYHSTPQDVQMIMIDPKQVEMQPYRDIPFLRIPVVTDPKKAAGALCWAVSEMTLRYKQFAERGVRDIDRFNALLAKEGTERMPKLVIFIDELADLMMKCKNEVEDAICRIAQLGRAAGIHLVLATQRPSVDVVTGLIKANVPSRIAMSVASQIDSRTMINSSGAEKLLGQGDMLFMPIGKVKPVRLQGGYLSDDDLANITDYLKSFGEANYDTEAAEAIERVSASKEPDKQDSEPVDDDADELMPKALRLAIEYEQASASMFQRKLKVGYARAARIVDEMEQRGYVSAADGSKPRQVLISWTEFCDKYGQPQDGAPGATISD